jgi:hypothetical protein
LREFESRFDAAGRRMVAAMLGPAARWGSSSYWIKSSPTWRSRARE